MGAHVIPTCPRTSLGVVCWRKSRPAPARILAYRDCADCSKGPIERHNVFTDLQCYKHTKCCSEVLTISPEGHPAQVRT